jgi:hypothetical protein
MKNIVTLLFASSLFLVLNSMELNSTGRAVHTGAPGEQTCARSGCHDSFGLNTGSGSITINAPGLENNQYVPGQNYTVQVTVAFAGRNLFGVGFEALLNSGANAGVLTAGAGNQILTGSILGNVRNTIAHVQNGGASPNTHTFQFTWTAPAAGAGTVTFYTAGVCANGNGGDSGDNVYSTSRTLNPLEAPTTPQVVVAGDNVLCEGESVVLSVTSQPGVTFTWQNENGTALGSGAQFTATSVGCYSVVASNVAGSAPASESVCLVLSNPDAAFSGLPPSVCIDAPPLNLQPLTPGGDFSGSGISGQVFSPAAAGEGFHQVQHTITDLNGCSANATVTTEVIALPAISFESIEGAICANAAPVVLVPSVEGAVFNGNGMQGDNFNPALANIGVNTISLVYTASGCSTLYQSSIEVVEAPSAEFAGLDPTYCLNAEDIVLLPVQPGGVFSGNGIGEGNSFSPASAGIGVWTIEYAVVLDNGCTAALAREVNVVESGNSAFAPLAISYCTNDVPVPLIPELPGGSFSGNGVENEAFNPSQTGPGEFTVVYTLNLGDCSSESAQSIVVLEAPDASFSGLDSSYCVNDAMVVLSTVTNGGDWSGPGVLDNTFQPQLAGAGEVQVMYTLVADNGCVDAESQEVEIRPLPDAALEVEGGAITAVAGADAYDWFECDSNMPIPNEQTSLFTSELDGAFFAQITTNGCTAITECVTVEVVSVQSVFGEHRWQVYPNPVASWLNLAHASGPFTVEVVTLTGALVVRHVSSGSALRIDVSAMSPGMYVVRLMSDEEVNTMPVIIGPR